MPDPTVSILGAGVMGALHANVVAGHHGATLAAVCDVDGNQAARVANRHGATPRTDVDAACKESDAVIIATPEPTHADLLDRAVSAGCAVLLEKPITAESRDVERIKAIATETARPIVPGHLLRFDPRYAAVKAAIEDGELGDLLSLSARRAIPRAWSQRMGKRVHPVKQIGTHDIDLLRWFCSTPITRVRAVATERALSDLGIPDAIHATLSFEDGVTATVVLIGLWPDEFPADIDARMEVVGSRGGSIVQIPAGGVQVAAQATSYPDTAYWPTVHGRVTGTLRSQFDHFLDCFVGGDPLVTMEDAVRTFEITEAIESAIEVDGPVDVAP